MSEDVIAALYASEINARIEWFWDGGVDVRIGDDLNGWRETANLRDGKGVSEWLRAAALRLYPNSVFAEAHIGATQEVE